MSIQSKTAGILCATAILILSAGCGNVNREQASTTPVTTENVQATDPIKEKSKSLFQAGIPEYDGSGRGYIVGEEQIQSELSAHQTLPLALFLPVTMSRYNINGNTAWGSADKKNYITLIAADDKEDSAAGKRTMTGQAEALLIYKEYMGNRKDGEETVEVFMLTAKGLDYRAEIHLLPQDQDELLPLFIDMLRQIQYMEKKEPLTGGVFVQEPDTGNSMERKQMLREAMNCLEAIAAKNVEQFKGTLYYPEANGELQRLFIDNKSTYRFTEMTFEGIPAEGTQRANFNVNYTMMTDEGYQSERGFTISLLRNKQGEWKVANID